MKKKGMVKFKGTESKGVMHYVEYNGKTVGLSVFESQKVQFIQKSGCLEIAFDLKSKEFNNVPVTIVTEPDYIEEVYEDMLQKDNTYFKEGYNSLCVLVFQK